MSSRLLFAVCGVLVVVSASALAQAKSATRAAGAKRTTAAPSERTTLNGVYTAAQAARGKNVYAGMCRSCHAPESHTGATFAKWWVGKHVSDLFAFISTNMPKNDPASLDPQDYADVTAYLLRMNALPAGKAEMPADSTELSHIRIVVAKPKVKRSKR